jgi:hypothetical protein
MGVIANLIKVINRIESHKIDEAQMTDKDYQQGFNSGIELSLKLIKESLNLKEDGKD